MENNFNATQTQDLTGFQQLLQEEGVLDVKYIH